MEIITQSALNVALDKAIGYEQYKKMVSNLIDQDKSTGNTQSEALLNYSKLNDRRMHRLDKTLKITKEQTAIIGAFSEKVDWLVLTESWCGDAAQTMPVMNKVAQIAEGINLKVVLRDEHEALMSQFLTEGNKAIPKLIAVDSHTKEVLWHWGPRPSEATALVNNFKKEHGTLTAQFKQDLQMWYTKDKGQDTLNDLLAKLK